MSENPRPRLTKKDWGKESRRKKLNCSLQSLPVKNSAAPEHKLRNTQLRMKKRTLPQRLQGSRAGPDPGPMLPRPGLLKLMKYLLKQKMTSRDDRYRLDLAAGVQVALFVRGQALDGTDLLQAESHLPQASQSREHPHRVSHPEIDSNQGLKRVKSLRRSQQGLLRRLEALRPLLGRNQYSIQRKRKIRTLSS